ncbi:unnamed protein product, partial [Strongylus vulgaris]
QADLQATQGLVVSLAPKALVQRFVPERKAKLEPVNILVPVVPSVFPKRLQELPEMPRSFQEDLSKSLSIEVPDEETPEPLTNSVPFESQEALPNLKSLQENTEAFGSPQPPIQFTGTSPSKPLEHLVSGDLKQLSQELQEASQELQAGPRSISNELSNSIPFPFPSIPQEVPELPPLDTSAQLIQEQFSRPNLLPLLIPSAQKPPIPLAPPVVTSEIPPERRYTTMKVETVKPILQEQFSRPNLLPLLIPSAQKPPIPLAPPVVTSEIPPEQRYTTMKVETVKPILQVKPQRNLRIKSPFIRPDRTPTEEGLWWTPKPSFLGNPANSVAFSEPKKKKPRLLRKGYKTVGYFYLILLSIDWFSLFMNDANNN